MVKVLVTGAAGQLGQAFADIREIAKGLSIELILLDRQQLDITSAESIDRALELYQPDVLVNGAAYTAVDKAEQAPDAAWLLNVQGPTLLAQACAKKTIWLLQVSTDYVFDGQKADAYSELDLASPSGVYGHTKLEGEQVVLAVNSDNLVLRTSWVFSEFGNNFLKTMLRLAAERDELRVVHDQKGGPTYAPHIAETLLKLINFKFHEGKEIKGGIYHFSGQPTTSWYEFAVALLNTAKEMGKLDKVPKVIPITTAEYPTPAKRPANSTLDNTKIKESIGFSLQNDWQSVLKKAIGEKH